MSVWSIAVLFMFSIAAETQADLVWLKGSPKSLSGWVVSSAGPNESKQEIKNEIEFRVFQNERFLRARTIQSDQIELVVRNIDVARLGKLSPERPSLYRDYAEELSVHKNDPAARDLAKRLFLLAAKNSTEDLRQSSMLGLLALANSADEYNRLKTLCILAVPTMGDLKGEMQNPFSIKNGLASQSKKTEEDRERMLKLVHAIRREMADVENSLLKDNDKRKSYANWEEICSVAELDQIAAAERPSRVQLAKLLAIEIQVLQSESPAVKPKQDRGWGDSATQPSAAIGVLPTFENVTRFDPRQSVFRDGKWDYP
ncbi:MAG: hypothetical protein AB8B55_02650 [Mariniblastus sp.]